MARWKAFNRKKKSQEFISRRIKILMKNGFSQKQASAIAYSEARKKKSEPTESEKKYYPSLSNEYGY